MGLTFLNASLTCDGKTIYLIRKVGLGTGEYLLPMTRSCPKKC